MLIARAKGNGGTYFYFFCRGRQKHLCDLPYLSVAKIETAVDKHLGTVRLTDSFQAAVRRQLDDALLLEQGHMSAFKKRLGARLDELDTKEDGLLDLLDDPEWPRAKIIFSKLHVDAEIIAGHDLTDGFHGLIEVGTKTVTNDKSGPLSKEGTALDRMTDADLLEVVLEDHGSSKAAMVEVPGIEPGSSGGSQGLLRAQSAVPLLGSTGLTDEPV
jgi:hypothetical protein